MIVQMDPACELEAVTIRSWLNLAPTCFLRLFTNDLEITPASTNPLDFLEANYPGYAPFGAAGFWPVPVRVAAGNWVMQVGPLHFPQNTGTEAATIQGWHLQRMSQIVYAEKFPTPLIVPAGAPGISLLVRLRIGSQSVLCTCPPGQ